MDRRIIIFDTTLRDGEQSLRVALNATKKLRIALALENLGVDVMEVGFPISSPEDFNAVQTIAKQVKNSIVCGLARCINEDIDVAVKALQVAKYFRIHVFLATSSVHIESKLKRNFSQIIEMAVNSIKYARRYTDDVEFSCEDAGRTSIDNLCRIVEASIFAGASTVNIPDTVGYTVPNEFSFIIHSLFERVPNIDKAIISVHCHDDLGMAVGNSIAAIQAGACQVEGTMNGIGERAGNTALEELIMAIQVRKSLLKVFTNIDHKKIYQVSKIVSQLCCIPIPYNKAIIGSNAFSHSSGIHQDGILKNRWNYEIIIPESIGRAENELHLTSRSGRSALKYHMKLMGYNDDEYNLESLYHLFINLADKNGQVFDYDLESLAFIDCQENIQDNFILQDFSIQYSFLGITAAAVKLMCEDKDNVCIDSSVSISPLYAMYKTLRRITNISCVLTDYRLIAKSSSGGIFVKSNVTIEFEGRYFQGFSSKGDFIESFTRALMNAFNNVWRSCKIRSKLNKL